MALNSILLGLFACATFISSCSCFCETSDFGQNHYTCNTLEDLAKISKKNEATTIVVKQHQMPFRCSQPVFQDFPKTRQIRIQDGAVISVGQNCFIGLYEIDEIDLKYNRITDFDASSLNGSNVSWLILTGNQLTSMGFKELVLPKLRHLILSKNKLNNLIVERGNFPTLIEISADNNEITSFQIVNNEIYSLTISENKIRAFFADNLRAPNLHFLHLERNKLTGIHSHALQNLPKLKEIRLEGNPIEMVDFGFANVTHFRITDDNIIITQERKEEPLSIFVNWENVQRLILSSNKIKTFKIQRYVSNGIEELKLDNNLIETIDRDDLKIFNNLFMLDLSNNRISSINYDSFSMLRKLHTLNLNNNCIQSLSASLFNSLPSIVNINLSYNLITYFPIPGWNNQTQEVRMTEFHVSACLLIKVF